MSTTPPMSLFESYTGFESQDATKDNKVITCPFCNKEEHFFFNPDSNLWDCKRCSKSGNAITFINLIHDLCNNSPEHLMELKGIPRRTIEACEIKVNPFTNMYMIPTFNNGKLNNLYRYLEKQNKVMCPKGLGHTLFMDRKDSEDLKQQVWVAEGHFDKLAGMAIAGNTREISVVAVPGASVLKNSWIDKLAGKDVILFYDNDEPGELGLKKAFEKFSKARNKPKSLRYIHWKDAPPKYDLRDLYIDNQRKSWSAIQPMLRDTPQEGASKTEEEEAPVVDLTCDSFEKVLEAYSKIYYMTDDVGFCLLAVLSSIYSIKLDGEQVWLKIIGPAGCGKTSIAKAVSTSPQTVLKSTFTGLFSGWKEEGSDGKEDASLVPQIQDKTLIVKDADALLQQPNFPKIISELRDFYDKDSSVHYGNLVERSYTDVRSSIIICGTQALRHVDNSFLGERFMDFELHITEKEESAIASRAMDHAIALAMGDVVKPKDELMQSVAGFIQNLMEKEPQVTMGPEIRKELWSCAYISSRLRTEVIRYRNGDIKYPPKPEVPSRLVGQFTNLVISMCVVLGLKEPDALVISVLRKISKDIINTSSARYKICEYLASVERAPSDSIQNNTGIPKTTCWRHIQDLELLGFVRSLKVSVQGAVGRKGFMFKLDDTIKERFINA